MAAVYLCRDEAGDAVAVKWLDLYLPGAGPEDETLPKPLLLRFEREVRSMAKVVHPGVVRYRGHGEWGGRPYLVMDHVEGSDLRVYADKLAQRPPAERYARCRTIGQSLCEALQAMHDAGLVHRDVKPSNVLVDPAGRVVLTDLGVVKDLAEPEQTARGIVVGTIAYASTEQLDDGEIGPWTDQYGIGATLYYLLTLERPFASARRRVEDQLAPPSRLDPEIPADLEAVILRLMAPNAADRFASCAEAAAALSTDEAPRGLPLAGRGEDVRQITAWLDGLEQQSVVIELRGPRGVGRRWLAGVVRGACAQRGLTLVEPADPAATQVAIHRAVNEPRVVVLARHPVDPQGLRHHVRSLRPLRVADLRRTVVAVAPLTEDPARVALRLHHFTGGLPALLLPQLERHVRGSRLVLPDTLQAGDELLPFLDGLDLDTSEVLGAIAVCDGGVHLSRLEAIACLPPEDAVDELLRQGLVQRVDDEVALLAEAFRQPSLDRLPDPDALRERARREAPRTRDSGADPESLALHGKLAAARDEARRRVVSARGDGDDPRVAAALIVQGQICLDMGDIQGAKTVLADASAMAKAIGDEPLRRRAHVLRARAMLDGHDLARGRGRAAAAAALDRVVPLGSGADRREDPYDALLFAMWARAASALGDRRAAVLAADRAGARLDRTPDGLHARVCLALARAARLRRDSDAAWAALARVRPDERALALVTWEVEVEEARLGGSVPPPVDSLAEGLSDEEREALAARR
ncbi:MAG: serine/threonine protein kinase [Alphaproteobacteria bacterium]|nr:serine/threonine protein kinase [Alphaproteobacteria bacterium]